ncbi:hypothetical protein ACFX2I_030421 [Malus domestica]
MLKPTHNVCLSNELIKIAYDSRHCGAPTSQEHIAALLPAMVLLFSGIVLCSGSLGQKFRRGRRNRCEMRCWSFIILRTYPPRLHPT